MDNFSQEGVLFHMVGCRTRLFNFNLYSADDNDGMKGDLVEIKVSRIIKMEFHSMRL